MKYFYELYIKQQGFQRMLIENSMYGDVGCLKIPVDNVPMFSYHLQAMISELGELMESDKRWKNYRNVKYDRRNKLEEIADCFISMMNIAMFSGFESYELEKAICDKIEENFKRVKEEIESKKKEAEQQED